MNVIHQSLFLGKKKKKEEERTFDLGLSLAQPNHEDLTNMKYFIIIPL